MKLRFLIGFSLLAITYILTACDREKFKPDRNDKRLPKYTEKGNQVAGALINDVAWKTYYSTFGRFKDELGITNYPKGDSIHINLAGDISEGPNKSRSINFSVVIRNFQVKDIYAVKDLHGVIFFLDGKNNYAIMDDFYHIFLPNNLFNKSEIRFGKGEFYIKRVQTRENVTHNNGNQSYHPYIISGTFNFEFDNSGTKISVEKGRFDFKFYDGNLSSIE